MSLFTPLRRLGILLAFVGTHFVLGRLWLSPLPLERAPAPVVFPRASPLPGWEAIGGEPDPALPNTSLYRSVRSEPALELELQFIADLPTHYIRNPLIEMRFLPRGHLPLDARMHYYVNSRGRIIANLRGNPPIDALVEARGPSPRSGYGVWTADRRLHLSTVMTPGGDTSMATRRVARSTYWDPVTPGRFGQWLLGRVRFPDRRGVLVHFSIPEPAPAAGEKGRRALENAWAEWQRAFRPVFGE